MGTTSPGWPAALWLVRHGESEGNVANELARKKKALRLDIDVNDIDIPLSATGAKQAQALGRWLAELPRARQPTAVVVSPYLRTQQTAQTALDEAKLDSLPVLVDERLRDREQGVLDRLTGAGFRERYPEEAERHAYLGKFWYRPTGGESWADVALRVRAALLELRLEMADERLLVVSHDVPILIMRYVIEAMSVTDTLALSGQVHNCSVTRYENDGHALRLEVFSDTAPLDRDAAAPVTKRE